MDFSVLRNKMVEEQLIPRGIDQPRLLAAFQKVPRHKFVSEKYLDSAYGDFPLPIDKGQTISQPYIVAVMTQYLGLTGNETVLEIGTGSGYQTAILAELAKFVYTVERLAPLAKHAAKILKDLDYRNVSVKVADGTAGLPSFAPYDGIVVTAGSPAVPQPLLAQLNFGARLVIPIGGSFNQVLTVFKKQKDKIEIREICGCVFVPLLGKYGWAMDDPGRDAGDDQRYDE